MTLTQYLAERGAQSALARKLNVTPVLVHQWSSGKRHVPAERVLDIETATEGAVSRHELRPDVFGPAPTPEAAA